MSTAHYTRTQQLTDWDRAYLWHPFTQMQEWEREQPVIISGGKGAYLIDTEGRRYLDGVSSIWVNVHGHRHPVLDRALRSQLKAIAHSTLLGLSSPPAIELARELIRIAPPGLTRVFYSDDG
ncbi:MAG: aminotransferase class III-fold pyridoxal phosphate-dependent enzyme, partial [Nitrospiraceae bacterium]